MTSWVLLTQWFSLSYVVHFHQAPTLRSAVPPGEQLPASLVHAGLLVLRTADPYDKAAITHAAWSAYQQGQLPLHPRDQEQQQQQERRQLQGQQEHGEGDLTHAPVAHPSLAHLIPPHPARPERPRLVRPKDVSRDSWVTVPMGTGSRPHAAWACFPACTCGVVACKRPSLLFAQAVR